LIRVIKRPEPADFDGKVRRPGIRYLEGNQNPDFKRRRRYWSKAMFDLYEAYDRICAYSCCYLVANGSVDHFLPKRRYPQLAYEWDNHRLASQRINSNKGDSTDVIDPFEVQNGWFVLDFPSCLIRAGSGLSNTLTDQIEKTIDELKLNTDDHFVQGRCDLMVSYAYDENDEFTLNFLKKKYPFIALEISRQNISKTDAKALFRRRKQ